MDGGKTVTKQIHILLPYLAIDNQRHTAGKSRLVSVLKAAVASDSERTPQNENAH